MLKLASSLGFAYTIASLRRRARSAAVQAILAAVGLLFFLGAVVFALIALHIWLSGEIGPVASAGVIAAVLLVLGLIFALLARRPPRRRPTVDNVGEQLGETLQQSYARLAQAGGDGSPFTNPVVLGMAAALVAGFLLGRRS